ncbi:MAG: hypothetical protein IJW35_03740 [Lentisphaeria bacterium]|nr:hypothetical protein [Lentisphaeria bacterium]
MSKANASYCGVKRNNASSGKALYRIYEAWTASFGIKAACRRLSEAIKRNTILTRDSEKTSQANEMSDFTSKMERKRSETTSQARLLVFGEDVKKRLRLLSEVVLRTEK